MKRYKLCKFSLDTTRNLFRQTRNGELDKEKEKMRKWLISRYGDRNFDEKFRRYIALEKPAISIVAEHTYLLEDICDSYSLGSLYSALTGACCLGERILNDIIFKVMGEFKQSNHYKKVYNKESIDDWGKAIDILSDWKILDKKTKKKYLKLHKLRIDSVHYQKKEQDLEEISLAAINTINFIIGKLFGIGRHQEDILICFAGEFYIKKVAETDPMVKVFYIPCSELVGPRHIVKAGTRIGDFIIEDSEKYDDIEISDAEFVKLRNEFRNHK